ncbi:ribosomal protein L7/L12 [candidate division KSB1 bacterium]|nr:ribosomal protein L7/L12 [candidate division KSB1 bacterium]
MGDMFLLGLAIGGLIAAFIVIRLTSGQDHQRTLARMEAKLDALLKHHGIHFNPYKDVPPSVVEVLRRGRKIEAIKEYRRLTGAGLKEAKYFVEEVWRRSTPRD